MVEFQGILVITPGQPGLSQPHKMAQSSINGPLNDATPPVDIEEEGLHLTTDRQWLTSQFKGCRHLLTFIFVSLIYSGTGPLY